MRQRTELLSDTSHYVAVDDYLRLWLLKLTPDGILGVAREI